LLVGRELGEWLHCGVSVAKTASGMVPAEFCGEEREAYLRAKALILSKSL
jgi:hypothetical protein